MAETTLARRQLGVRLKRLREAAGKTLADVETATGVGSASKLWRIETGRTSVRTGDVRDLCALYETPAAELEPLLALARASKGEGWWEDYTDVVLAGFGLYLDLEAAAASINAYDAELIHGLLQTPDYHRAVTVAESRTVTDADMERFEQLRAERVRATLGRPTPCQLTAIIGEAALHRQIGTPEIMTRQLKHLSRLVADDAVDIRVLTWTVGSHAALRSGAFTILDFADEDDPDVVYLETLTDARYRESDPHLRAYREAWAMLVQQSVPLKEHL